MKKFATCALVGILMAFAAVPASAATVESPTATVVVQETTKPKTGTTTDNSGKSPKTGDFSAAPYVLATLSMAAAVVACKAVKTSKEQ